MGLNWLHAHVALEGKSHDLFPSVLPYSPVMYLGLFPQMRVGAL